LYCLNVRGCEINRKLWVITISIEKEIQGTAEMLMVVAQVLKNFDEDCDFDESGDVLCPTFVCGQ